MIKYVVYNDGTILNHQIIDNLNKFSLIKNSACSIDEIMENNAYIVIAIDESSSNKIVGLIFLEEKTSFLPYNIKIIEVLTEYRGQGIGKYLMIEAINYIRINGCRLIELISYESKNFEFFKKFGFKYKENSKMAMYLEL